MMSPSHKMKKILDGLKLLLFNVPVIISNTILTVKKRG